MYNQPASTGTRARWRRSSGGTRLLASATRLRSLGLVDCVLPPGDMPAQLIAFAARHIGGLPAQIPSAGHHAEAALKKILVLLRDRTNHDFSQYKQNTVARRVERRMAVHQIEM